MLLRFFKREFFGSRQVLKKGFLCDCFLVVAFHVGFRQICPKLVSHRILDIYPNTKFMNKGVNMPKVDFTSNAQYNKVMSIVTKLHEQCD